MIAEYPEFSEITMDERTVLHPKFQSLADGISEFTFANIFLFRETHQYRLSRLDDELFVITGKDNKEDSAEDGVHRVQGT